MSGEEVNVSEGPLDKMNLHAMVRGRVQGVGFRAFTQNEASRRGLNGWVKNRSDGTVELEAEGSRFELKKFLKALQEGPALARVESVTVDWTDSNRQTQGFTILP